MTEIRTSKGDHNLNCDLCGNRYPASEVAMRGKLNFCQACAFERSSECLSRLQETKPKSRLPLVFATLFALCCIAGAAYTAVRTLQHSGEAALLEKSAPAETAEPKLISSSVEKAPAAAPASESGIPANLETPWIQKIFPDRSKQSVADVGNLNVLFVRGPGTDSRLGLSSRVFGTREAPNNDSAKLISEVGPQMASSFEEGLRYVRKLPRAWEKEFSIRLSFEDKYTKKDGGSAATAFTIVMLSAIQGVAIDPDVAVTGDLTIDGTVQPVGGVIEKVRGAIDGKCKITLIPDRNSRDMVDLVLLHGISPLWETQVFSISTIDQALSLARRDRSEEVKNAIARFDALRARLPAVVTPNYLQSPIVQSELKEVLRFAPNHLSAATLLSAAEGKLPRELSLNRSVEEILVTSYLFITDIVNPAEQRSKASDKKGIPIFPEREFGECISKLHRITSILDRRSLELKTTCVAYASALRAVSTYQMPDLKEMRTRQNWAELARKERGLVQDIINEANESKTRFLLALHKLDADGSLLSEMRKK